MNHPIAQLHHDALQLLARMGRLEKAVADAPAAVRPAPEGKVGRGKGGRFVKKV